MAFPQVTIQRETASLSDTDRRAILVGQSGSPYAVAVQITLQKRLDVLRRKYEDEAANETTRGMVLEVRRLIETLSTGDIYD